MSKATIEALSQVTIEEFRGMAVLYRRLNAWTNRGKPMWPGAGSCTMINSSLAKLKELCRVTGSHPMSDLLAFLRATKPGSVIKEPRAIVLSIFDALAKAMDKPNYIHPTLYTVETSLFLLQQVDTKTADAFMEAMCTLEKGKVADSKTLMGWTLGKALSVLPVGIRDSVVLAIATYARRPIFESSLGYSRLLQDFPMEYPALVLIKSEVSRLYRSGPKGFRVPSETAEQRRATRVAAALSKPVEPTLVKLKDAKPVATDAFTAADLSKDQVQLLRNDRARIKEDLVKTQDKLRVLYEEHVKQTKQVEELQEELAKGKKDIAVARGTAWALKVVLQIIELGGDPSKTVTAVKTVLQE